MTITKIYTRTYRDNNQTTTYVEWIDKRGRTGRTEGNAKGTHMAALIARAEREGLNVGREIW